jgi:hypothetical protein
MYNSDIPRLDLLLFEKRSGQVHGSVPKLLGTAPCCLFNNDVFNLTVRFSVAIRREGRIRVSNAIPALLQANVHLLVQVLRVYTNERPWISRTKSRRWMNWTEIKNCGYLKSAVAEGLLYLEEA